MYLDKSIDFVKKNLQISTVIQCGGNSVGEVI